MAFIYFMYFSVAVAIWGAFDVVQALVTLIVLSASMPYLWFRMRSVITVDDQELLVNRAHIELQFLKDPIAVDRDGYRKLRTINSDARSYHATRPWLDTGVKVAVNDERDKTSYWLIGSKRNEALVEEIIKRSRGIQR